MNRRFQMHHMQMIESNKEATQQRMTPSHMMKEPTMYNKLNRLNHLRSLDDQICCQPPRYHRHVAEILILPYSISFYVANYLMFNH
jgi:hypothetical protein